MKRFFLLLLVLFSLAANAKPARFYYYCLTPTQESVSGDGFVSIEYVTMSNFKNYIIPNVGSVDYAHPVLELLIKNTSQQDVVIYTSESIFKRNSHKKSFSDIVKGLDELVIPAGEVRSFIIDIVTNECLGDISSVFSIINVPAKTVGAVPAGKFMGIQVNQYQRYKESESLFKLLSQIVYSLEGDAEKYSVTTSYYLDTIVGVSHTGLGVPRVEDLAEVFPEGMSDRYETFVLINSKK